MGNSCIKPRRKNSVLTPPENNNIIKWKADRKTEKYHWWPMLETNPNDYINNLYAEGGGLGKYDSLFGSSSCDYQRKNYYRDPSGVSNDMYWAGFCDKATALSCLYEYPKRDVSVMHKGKIITFNTRDIEALMIIASDNSVNPNISLFFGLRNDGNNFDDKREPYPSDLLRMLMIISLMKEPFAMDIDNGESVWNYSFDSIKVSWHNKCLIEHIPPQDGKTTYYNFKLFSEAYPDKNQDLWGYTNTITDSDGITYKQEKWLSDKNPDFIWQKFKKEESWTGRCLINPEIDAGVVYRIYIHSLREYDEMDMLIIY